MAISDLTVSVVMGTAGPPFYEGDEVTVQISWNNSVSRPHVLTINWGDGTSAVSVHDPDTSYELFETHTYDVDGLYAIDISVYDGVDPPSLASTMVQIENAPPNIIDAAGVLDNTEGVVDITYLFSDAGKDTWTITIDWGDGTIDSHDIAHDPGILSWGYLSAEQWNELNAEEWNAFPIAHEASHTYTSFPSGSLSHRRLITLTIDDNSGGVSTTSFYPTVLFTDGVSDVAVGSFEPHGVVDYSEEVVGEARGELAVAAIKVVGAEAFVALAEFSVEISISIGFASILVITRLADCFEVGKVPFEKLVSAQKPEDVVFSTEAMVEESYAPLFWERS